MNETEVVRFLATEVMGWKWKDGIVLIHTPEQTSWMLFDPIHNIAHAFMVVEKIATIKNGERVRDRFEGYFKAEWISVLGLNPENISIAAVRALATDEQIASWL